MVPHTSSKTTLAQHTHKVFLHSLDCCVRCAHDVLPDSLRLYRPCVVKLTAHLVCKWCTFVLHFFGGQMERATETQGSFVVALARQVAAKHSREHFGWTADKDTVTVLTTYNQKETLFFDSLFILAATFYNKPF